MNNGVALAIVVLFFVISSVFLGCKALEAVKSYQLAHAKQIQQALQE
jgi:hypothetical protein